MVLSAAGLGCRLVVVLHKLCLSDAVVEALGNVETDSNSDPILSQEMELELLEFATSGLPVLLVACPNSPASTFLVSAGAAR